MLDIPQNAITITRRAADILPRSEHVNAKISEVEREDQDFSVHLKRVYYFVYSHQDQSYK